MRLTGAEEAGNPDTHPVGNGRIFEIRAVALEEIPEMFFQLVGDNILFQFLPDGCVIRLVCFDHTIDGTVQRFEEEVFNGHC